MDTDLRILEVEGEDQMEKSWESLCQVHVVQEPLPLRPQLEVVMPKGHNKKVCLYFNSFVEYNKWPTTVWMLWCVTSTRLVWHADTKVVYYISKCDNEFNLLSNLGSEDIWTGGLGGAIRLQPQEDWATALPIKTISSPPLQKCSNINDFFTNSNSYQ